MKNNTSSSVAPKGWRVFAADRLAVRGARLIDPQLNLDLKADLFIKDGAIVAIGDAPSGFSGQELDARGWIICPGLFDMHVHLREPGYEYKETVESGCWAAVSGGFTGVAPMPNTSPAVDSPGIVQLIREKAANSAVDVHPIGAVTVGRRGERLAEMAELAEAGVTGFSDDGSPVKSAELMRLALEYTRMLDAVVIEHCEESSMTEKGVADEGPVATALGLPAWPRLAETIAIERNIQLAEYTGGRLHVAHLSTAEGVDLVRAAKAKGVRVTAEVTPHHLVLTVDHLRTYDADFKVNPPLRTQADCEALATGLADGIIDAVASDHAPHAIEEKELEFIYAPFGMLGLETTLSVMWTHLVLPGKLTANRLIESLTCAPRNILRLPPALLKTGEKANLTLFNPDEKWTVDRDLMLSKSHNTPYHDWRLTGRARGVVNRGVACLREG